MHKKYLALFILLFILSLSLLNCRNSIDSSEEMNSASTQTSVRKITTMMSTEAQIAKSGDTVKVDYIGKLVDGTVFDSSIGTTPLTFTLGDGTMIEGFDKAVIGMKIDETKQAILSPAEAYGNHLDQLVMTVDKSEINPDMKFYVGQQLTGKLRDGTEASVIVVAVSDTTVTVDGNHPLAGRTLIFDITLRLIMPKN